MGKMNLVWVLADFYEEMADAKRGMPVITLLTSHSG
jgi:hypothetical protein